jgi:hypothetical protein
VTATLDHLAEAVLRLSGCPVGRERALWSPRGVRRFLRHWPQTPGTSPQGLRLLLGLFDPDVRLEWLSPLPLAPSAPQPDGGVTLGVVVRPRRARVRIVWNRGELASYAGVVARAVAEVLGWWAPFGWQDVVWDMTWEKGLAVAQRDLAVCSKTGEEDVMSTVDALLRHYAEAFLGVRQRGATPPRTLVSLTAARLLHKAAGEVVLSDRLLGRFLRNPRPIAVAWRVGDERRTADRLDLTLLPLGDGVRRLNVLAPPEWGAAAWTVNGTPVQRRPLTAWPELFSFDLPEPAPRDVPQKLCGRWPAAAQATPGRWYPNPVVFEAASPGDDYLYQPCYGSGGEQPGTFENLVQGGEGIDEHVQPLPVHTGRPKETDAEWFARASEVLLGRLARRTDVGRLVAGRFGLSPRQVRCRETVWFDAGPPPQVVQGVEVTVRPPPSGPGPADGLREQVQRFLETRLRVGLTPRVLLEKEHE